jgi:ATP-binding cassette, subfamily F, member 3
VVFVSHDRYFIDQLATRVFEIGDGRIEVYPGNYEDFLWRKQGGAAKLEQELMASHRPELEEKKHAAVDTKSKRLNPIKRKQMENRAQELEREISRLEAAIGKCESSLENFTSAEDSSRLSRELDQNRRELEERISEWEHLGRELEA